MSDLPNTASSDAQVEPRTETTATQEPQEVTETVVAPTVEALGDTTVVDAISDTPEPMVTDTEEVEETPVGHQHTRRVTSDTVEFEVSPIHEGTGAPVVVLPDARAEDMGALAQMMEETLVQDGSESGNYDLQKYPEAKETLILGGLGSQMLFQEGEHNGALDRKGSEWKQYVKHGERKLRPTTPNLSQAAEGAPLKDQVFMQHLRTGLGHGSHFLIPLWNSGFWLDLRAIPDHERNLMLERLVLEKFALGRSTGGLIYGNNEIHFYRHFVDLLVSHGISRSTIDGVPVVNLPDYILVSDVQYIAAGLAHLMYPNGYNYTRACTANPESCHHTVTEKIDLSTIFLADTSRITEKQIQHMNKARSKPVSVEEVMQYQKTVKDAANYVQDLNEVVRLHYTVPTLTSYIQAGSQWVSEVEGHVDSAFQGSLSRNKRESVLRGQVANTTLRMWSHWLQRIDVGQNYADTPEELQNALVEMSQNDEIVEKVITTMKEVMFNKTYSLVAIPAYHCPSCQQLQTSGNPKHPFAIPLNAVQMFFILSDAHPSYRSTQITDQ